MTAEREDLQWLIAREIPHLRRYALFLIGDRERADDLVQDCLERAIRKRHLWSRRGTLRSWLFRLLYRLHIDALREVAKHKRLARVAEEKDDGVQRPQQEPSVQVADVVTALSQLPSDQRAAILLVAVEGLAYDEAAQALDIPIGTLRSRLSRGRDALRASWQPKSEAGRERPSLKRVK